MAPIWAFGLFPRRGGAGRVFSVQLRTATVEVPSSHLIVCVLGETVSTLFRWKPRPRISGTYSALNTRNSFSMAVFPT